MSCESCLVVIALLRPPASRVTVQLLGQRQRLTLPEGDDLHEAGLDAAQKRSVEALTEVVAARFEAGAR